MSGHHVRKPHQPQVCRFTSNFSSPALFHLGNQSFQSNPMGRSGTRGQHTDHQIAYTVYCAVPSCQSGVPSHEFVHQSLTCLVSFSFHSKQLCCPIHNLKPLMVSRYFLFLVKLNTVTMHRIFHIVTRRGGLRAYMTQRDIHDGSSQAEHFIMHGWSMDRALKREYPGPLGWG